MQEFNNAERQVRTTQNFKILVFDSVVNVFIFRMWSG